MNKTKITAFILVMASICFLAAMTLKASAIGRPSGNANKIDISVYDEEHQPVSGIKIEAYKIANYNEGDIRPENTFIGTFSDVDDFSKNTFAMLSVVNDRIRTSKIHASSFCNTNKSGNGTLSHLKDGVYYIKSADIDGSGTIHPFFVVFPLIGEQENSSYVKCCPSYTSPQKAPEEIEEDFIELQTPEPVLIVINDER